MSTPRDWRVPDGIGDWMRDREKRQAHEERRPQVQTAADLLGPGFGPYAVELPDWNAEAGRFNGMWVSVDALNGPTPTGIYLGLTLGASAGHAVQVAFSHEGSRIYTRQVHSHESQGVDYTDWTPVGPAADSLPPGTMIGWPIDATAPSGYLTANGIIVNRNDFAALADMLGVPSDAATFRLPDVANSGGMRTIVKT